MAQCYVFFVQESQFFQHYELCFQGPPLGEGSFSVCRKCKHKQTGHEYAVKIVSRRWAEMKYFLGQCSLTDLCPCVSILYCITVPLERKGDWRPLMLSFFVRMEANTHREIAALRQCESHPNIVKLYDIFTDQVEWTIHRIKIKMMYWSILSYT